MRRLLPLLLLTSCSTAPAAPAAGPDIAEMQRIVRFLASDELKGRNNGTEEGYRAAQFIADEMGKLGLMPAGENGTWFQTVPAKGEFPTRNVLGILPGASEELLVICAHHDHLGIVRGEIHNGADDNASGVAMLLEVARRLKGEPLPRSILFASFDAEEDGLVGSRYFVTSGLIPAGRFASLYCLDLVGGGFLPGDEGRVFALGSECSPELHEMVRRLPTPEGLEVRPAGIYLIEPMGPILARSDYAPFRAAKVPYVFFSTGTPWYYHTPFDDVERLDFEKMDRIAGFLVALVRKAAASPRPTFGKHQPELEADAATMKEALDRIRTDKRVVSTPEQRAAASDLLDRIREAPDRAVLQQAMMLLFAVAAGQGPQRDR